MVVYHGYLMGTFVIQFITFDLPTPALSDECSIAKAQSDFRQQFGRTWILAVISWFLRGTVLFKMQ